ncbi:hypothetical protein Y032_0074g851 [Ancylostoma ceylanicum]|uniref:Uncharacterized protein n=1 Tax=Ancylostoma ceylanicum TaxID=53326 RepID=A0A016TUK8_9BILA|nr:hypothetical protein Y032_0074g851 [Ancylostoma ceylanicum]
MLTFHWYDRLTFVWPFCSLFQPVRTAFLQLSSLLKQTIVRVFKKFLVAGHGFSCGSVVEQLFLDCATSSLESRKAQESRSGMFSSLFLLYLA